MSEPKDLTTFFRRSVAFSKDSQEAYRTLIRDMYSPFRSKDMADVFVYAAVWGFAEKKKKKLKNPQSNVYTNVFDEAQKATLLSIAITEAGTMDVLFNEPKVVEIIQEYANYGIDRITSELAGGKDMATVIKQMSMDTKRMIDEWAASHASKSA